MYLYQKYFEIKKEVNFYRRKLLEVCSGKIELEVKDLA
jgi:hypothetical protein